MKYAVIKNNFPIAIFRLLVNTITQNQKNQEKHLEQVLCDDNLFISKSHECLKFSLISLYNTFIINPILIPKILNNKKALRWYKESFEFISKCKSVGIEIVTTEKEYAELYEWFTMLTFMLMKTNAINQINLNLLFGSFIDEGKLFHNEDSIELIRNSSENDTIIQPSIIQARFIQFLCSEVILQGKEDPKIYDELSINTINFLCKLFKVLITVFTSSYDILKACNDRFLSSNFTQDFQIHIHLLTVSFVIAVSYSKLG